MLDWINVFKVNRKIKSRLWPWIKIILSIILFFAVFYGDTYVHILDKTKTGRIVEALILVVFSFLDYLVCFISVAEMDCLKDRRYAAAKESGLYLTDTPTNVFPSIHVYNSVAVAVAVEHSEQLKNRPVFRNVCLGLTVLIVFSTMFLKQHSVSDVCCALVMNAGTCMLLYRPAKAGNALRTREKKAKYRM